MKKWLDEFFSLSEDLRSNTKPIIKLLLFPLIILALFFRPKSGIMILDGLVTVATIVILYYTFIYCLYIPISELFIVASNRKKLNNKGTKKPFRPFLLDQVAKMCFGNDIIDFEILSNGAPIHVGSSSELNPGESVFFDKQYYIDSTYYRSFELFTAALSEIAVNGTLNVVSIDDVLQQQPTG